MEQSSVIRRTLAAYARVPWFYTILLVALAFLFGVIWGAGPQDLTKTAGIIRKAHEAGDIARTHDYVQYWLTVVSKAGFFSCLALIVAGPWLVHGPTRQSVTDSAKPAYAKWLWISTAVITLASAAANAPRLHQSFWFDEECTARRFIVGEFATDGTFRKPKWERTLFYYNDPNNHPLCSILGRVGHELIDPPSAPDQFPFQEWAIRLPLFLFGLGGLAALAWMSSVAGSPKAGLFAVLLQALHPWYVRYSVETRGYALLLAFVPILLGSLLRALQSGRLGWFIAFGILEFLCLWSYPGVLYLLFMVNVACLGWIWLDRSEKLDAAHRRALSRRFLAGNAIGALLSTLALAPLAPPMLAYLKAERMRGQITSSFLAEAMAGLFTGQPWAEWGRHPEALALATTWNQSPMLVALGVSVLIGVAACGLLALWKTTGAFRWIGTAVLATGPFMVLMAWLQGNILYPWYIVFTLPVVLLVLAMGLELAASGIRGRAASWLLPLAMIGLFGAITWRQNRLLRKYPIEPMRESVLAMRPVPNPFSPETHRTLSGSLCYSLRLYDPFATPIKTLADLKGLMAEADATNAPLAINFANLGFARMRFPEIMAVLEDDTVFRSDAPYHGLHTQPERWVFRYLGTRPPADL